MNTVYKLTGVEKDIVLWMFGVPEEKWNKVDILTIDVNSDNVEDWYIKLEKDNKKCIVKFTVNDYGELVHYIDEESSDFKISFGFSDLHSWCPNYLVNTILSVRKNGLKRTIDEKLLNSCEIVDNESIDTILDEIHQRMILKDRFKPKLLWNKLPPYISVGYYSIEVKGGGKTVKYVPTKVKWFNHIVEVDYPVREYYYPSIYDFERLHATITKSYISSSRKS